MQDTVTSKVDQVVQMVEHPAFGKSVQASAYFCRWVDGKRPDHGASLLKSRL